MNFQEIKLWLCDVIVELLNLLESIGNDVETDKNIILKSLLCKISQPNFKNRDLLKNIKMIEREKMKCFVFGKTSNGKSSVINALLKKDVLPASKGRTTSCFIKIEGCDDKNGYLLDEHNVKQSLEHNENLINKLANQINDESLKIDFILEVFLPKNIYPLLRNDVSIFDSPGVDFSTATDNWINRYCEDADIFLLIVDGDSTLNESERKFFVKVQQIISTPKIFVLVNKWDEDDSSLKKQHSDTISKFLIEDLNVYDKETVFNYIYFVSARSALQSKDDGTFDNFASHLMNELSTNAIKTKFKPHIDTILDILPKVNDFINEYSKLLDIENKMSESSISDFKTSIHEHIDKQFEKILLKTIELIESKLLPIKLDLQNAVNENSDLQKSTIKFLEVEFPKYISQYFGKKVLALENLLLKIFLKQSIHKACTIEEIETYLFHGKYLKEISKKYEEFIVYNLQETACAIRNLFKGQESKQVRLERLKVALNAINAALMLPGFMLIKKFPVAAICLHLFGAVAGCGAHFIPTVSNESISNEIFEEFKSFYNSITKFLINKYKEHMKVEIDQSIENFIKDQKEIFELFLKFQSDREKCSRIETDVKNKKYEVEQLSARFKNSGNNK